MQVLTPLYKSGTTMPVYNDGFALILTIDQTDENYPQDVLVNTEKKIGFKMLSISDRLKFEFEQREKKISLKIRIPQSLEITSKTVLKLGSDYHKVYNAYHFTNKEGFPETDLTLEPYTDPLLKEDANG